MYFKINIYSIIKILFIVTLVFVLLYFYVSTDFSLLNFGICFFLLIGIEVCIFFSRLLTKIYVNEQSNTIQLSYSIFFIKEYISEIQINNLFFSYKTEAGAKGVKYKELRLYNNKREKIIGIGRGFDGWEEKTIQEIIKKFRALEILEIK